MYKKLLIATTNQNKVTRIKKLLDGTKLEVLSLRDLGDIPEPEETAKSCITIAMQKALHYLDYVDEDTLVLTQDDTIVFSGVNKDDNPSVHIKEPVVKAFGSFSDQNAMDYYTQLARRYGGYVPMNFEYGHALARKNSDIRERHYLAASASKLEARLMDKIVSPEKFPGYFLAAIMQVKINDVWHDYATLSDEELVKADSDLKDSILSLLMEVE